MEDQLRKLVLRSIPDGYADRVMNHIARAEAKRRGALIALGASALALMIGIAITLPQVVEELFAWLNDPFANLAPWFALEADEAMPNLLLIALVLGIGLSGVSAIFLARLNEAWSGAAA